MEISLEKLMIFFREDLCTEYRVWTSSLSSVLGRLLCTSRNSSVGRDLIGRGLVGKVLVVEHLLVEYCLVKHWLVDNRL